MLSPSQWVCSEMQMLNYKSAQTQHGIWSRAFCADASFGIRAACSITAHFSLHILNQLEQAFCMDCLSLIITLLSLVFWAHFVVSYSPWCVFQRTQLMQRRLCATHSTHTHIQPPWVRFIRTSLGPGTGLQSRQMDRNTNGTMGNASNWPFKVIKNAPCSKDS